MTKKTQQDIIYDLVQEVREDQKETNKVLYSIHTTMERNTSSLEQHMLRTATLEKMWEEHKNRLEVLEEPTKVKKFLQSKIVFYSSIITGIAGVIAAIMKIIG